VSFFVVASGSRLSFFLSFFLFIYRRQNYGGKPSNLHTSSNTVTVKLVGKDGKIRPGRG